MDGNSAHGTVDEDTLSFIIAEDLFVPVERYSSAVHISLEQKERGYSIPVTVFSNGLLSGLEAISKYLKEDMQLRFCEIAALLNRNDRTIWGAYTRAAKKMPARFDSAALHVGAPISIPLSLFSDRVLSVLESIVYYLKEELHLRYCTVARLLNRDERTIWTVCRRAQRKHQQYAISDGLDSERVNGERANSDYVSESYEIV